MVNRHLLVAALVLSLTVGLISACEKIALMPRPEIDRQGQPIDRDRDRDTTMDRDLSRNDQHDVVGTVERIDRADNEIALQTTDARLVMIKYDLSTVVYDRDRDIGVAGLRPRDQVRVQVSRNSRGEEYADTIRLNDSSALGIQTY